MKLQDLASVRSGLVLSRKQAKEPSEYRYPLINLRCIQQEGTIQLKEADIYEAKEPLKEEYLSQSGDIIVRLTAPYTAVLIDETTSGMVVSSNFVVIRVEDKSLLPEYLFWLLNTEKIKRKIYENATSNMLGAVNARFLADFELALLSVEDQRKISQFNLLAKRERQLLRMLADEKEKKCKMPYNLLVSEDYLYAGMMASASATAVAYASRPSMSASSGMVRGGVSFMVMPAPTAAKKVRPFSLHFLVTSSANSG